MIEKNNFLKGTCLITGGTGTYGTACVNYLLKEDLFEKIIVFSRDEFKQCQMKAEISKNFKNSNKVRFFIGDVRDLERLKRSFNGVDYVIHACALKNVDSTEYNPDECVKTNVFGTMNVVEASICSGVKKVLLISSDKSCIPTLCYGASKLLEEKFVIEANYYSKNTRFSIVRYGNIVGSRGSILETLLQNEDAEFKLTHKDMTRFFFMIDDAIQLSLFALQNSLGGEIFLPHIKSFRIADLFKLVNPNKRYVITGTRPDEKLHERLISESEVDRVALFDEYFVVVPEIAFWGDDVKKFYSDKKVNVQETQFISNSAMKLSETEVLLMLKKEMERLGNKK